MPLSEHPHSLFFALSVMFVTFLAGCSEKIPEEPTPEPASQPAPRFLSVHTHTPYQSLEFRDGEGCYLEELLFRDEADSQYVDSHTLQVESRFHFIEHNPHLALIAQRHMVLETDTLQPRDDPRSRWVTALDYHFLLINSSRDTLWTWQYVSPLPEPLQSRRRWNAILRVPEQGQYAGLAVGGWRPEEPRFFLLLDSLGQVILELDSLNGEPLDYPVIPTFSPSGEYFALRGQIGRDDYHQNTVLFLHVPSGKRLLYEGPAVMIHLRDNGQVKYKHPDYSFTWQTMDLQEKLGLVPPSQSTTDKDTP